MTTGGCDRMAIGGGWSGRMPDSIVTTGLAARWACYSFMYVSLVYLSFSIWHYRGLETVCIIAFAERSLDESH